MFLINKKLSLVPCTLLTTVCSIKKKKKEKRTIKTQNERNITIHVTHIFDSSRRKFYYLDKSSSRPLGWSRQDRDKTLVPSWRDRCESIQRCWRCRDLRPDTCGCQVTGQCPVDRRRNIHTRLWYSDTYPDKVRAHCLIGTRWRLRDQSDRVILIPHVELYFTHRVWIELNDVDVGVVYGLVNYD